MKKKTLLIVLAIVIIGAVSAAAAYAWWTAGVTVPNNEITTGTSELSYGGGTPIVATDLIPQSALPSDPADDPQASLDGYRVSYFYVHNSGDTPLHFVGWLDDGDGDFAVLGPQVFVKITIAPSQANGSPYDPTGSLSSGPGSPYLVYNGPINGLYGKDAGSQELTTLGHSPLASGQYAIYKVVTWLNGETCDDSSKEKSMSVSLKFEGLPVN